MVARLPITVSLALIALAAPCPEAALAEPGEGRRPNVILILADDLGYHDLSCYGHPSIRTPVLDRLAQEGIRLTNFHAGATVCTPSRMALLTGAYPVRVGWTRGVVGFRMGPKDGLSREALTMADIFKSEGYATAISGKWHIGNLPDTRPHRQGFDRTYYLSMSNNQTDKVWREDEVVEQPFDNRLLTRQFTDEAIAFVRTKKDRPFFLYLPYTAPHFPVEPHPAWEGRSDFGKYGDVVEELDHRIGELLGVLEELNLREHTIVVFCSDNGPQPGQAANSIPFRGEKWSALEGGTRVPAIVYWPGVIPAGRESGALISAMDLLPTLCRACGIDWKGKSQDRPNIDGLDVWDTLLGKEDRHPRSELLYWHGLDPEPQAIRVGEWKLFFDRRHALEGLGTARATPEQAAQLERYRAALNPGANPPFLFHLADDAGELEDRSAEFPEKVESLRNRAQELTAEIRAAGILPLATPAVAE